MKIKINWKVRFKQPAFWIATIPVVISFVYAILALFGVVPSITEETIQNAFIAIVAVLAQFGISVDHTTPGIGDSARALTYVYPGEPGEKGSGLMKFEKFIAEHLGKAIDYDGSCGAQCVDLAKMFMRKVLGIVPKAIGNAHAYFDNFNAHAFLRNNFVRIKNSRKFIPMAGDMCVWSKNMNGYGHIAIATGKGGLNDFESFDMNWDGKEAKLIVHNYNSFLGVLRPINRENIDGAILYRVKKAVNIRRGAGTGYARVMFDEFDAYEREQVLANGGKSSDNDFPKGMLVTVYETRGNWGKISKTEEKWLYLNGYCKEL